MQKTSPRPKWSRAFSVLLLLFVLVSASYACAAMPPAPLTAAHPCCPKSNHPNPDNCEIVGCLSTMPVLVSAPVDQSFDVAPAIPLSGPALVEIENSLLERSTATPGASPHLDL